MLGMFRSHQGSWWMTGVDVEWQTFPAARRLRPGDRTVTEILYRILARHGTAFPPRRAAGIVALCVARAAAATSRAEIAAGADPRDTLSRAFHDWFLQAASRDYIDALLRDALQDHQQAAA